MTNYDNVSYQVIKAGSIKELKDIVKEKIRMGLTPLGFPSVIHIRNQFNERMAVFYQPVAFTRTTPAGPAV
jgi:hypothetical protein